MAEKHTLNDTELDEMFAASRQQSPQPSEALTARILADAETQIAPVGAVRSKGALAGFLEVIGGWPAVAGLVTATVTGLMIGLSSSGSLDDLTSDYFSSATGYALEDFLPSYGDLLGEG